MHCGTRSVHHSQAVGSRYAGHPFFTLGCVKLLASRDYAIASGPFFLPFDHAIFSPKIHHPSLFSLVFLPPAKSERDLGIFGALSERSKTFSITKVVEMADL